jgi:type IV pilus assembly protein PilE
METRKHMHGMTLMELMVVVVIIGILTAIAFPNYREFVARAKRSEAKAALLQIATNQERFYLQNSTFTTDMTMLGFAADPYISDSDSYSIAVTAADQSDYTAVATYQFTDDESTKCNTWQIDGRGTKTSAPYTDCWTRGR